MMLVFAAVLLAIVAGARPAAADDMKIIKTTIGEDGLVYWRGAPANAEHLANASGAHHVTYCLARVMDSETLPRHPDIARIAVAHAVLNYATGKKIEVLHLVANDRSAYGGVLGKNRFGRQWRKGRYCASHNDPRRSTLQLAEDIRTGKIPDPTGGAIQWDSPRSQEAQKGATKTADEVAEARIKDGAQKVVLEGVPEDDLRLWRYA